MMYKVFFMLLMLCLPSAVWADSRCLPFFRNFSAKEYGAHNRSFDIVCDDYGTVFVANFEGLLYYDGATWRKLHTPGISRITKVAKGQKGRIWIGGYNIFGYIQPDAQGRLQMKPIISDATKGGFGEVDIIEVKANQTYVHTTNGKGYYVDKNETLVPLGSSQMGVFATSKDEKPSLSLNNGCMISYSHSGGLKFNTANSNPVKNYWAPLSEQEGLISNTVNQIAFNNDHVIWGATDQGLFCAEVLSPYGLINDSNGLKGEVNSITMCNGIVYAGTMEGLFKITGTAIERIANIDLACWQFDDRNDGKVFAATSDGLYKIIGNSVTHITTGNTLSVCMGNGDDCYTGEFDGIYHVAADGTRKQISQIEKATSLKLKGNELTVETIYGEQWSITLGSNTEKCIRQKADISEPRVNVSDPFGTVWTTDKNGRNLKASSKNKYATVLAPWLNPFKSRTISSLFISKEGDILVGGDFGVILLDGKLINKIDKGQPQKAYIRQITAIGDSVIWGGFGPDMKPLTEVDGIDLPSSCKHINVTFSTKGMSILQPALYRHRIDGERWSAWTAETDVDFNTSSYGRSVLEIQSMDLFGRISEPSRIEWYIEYPIYLRWWALLLYLIILIYGSTMFYRWRTNRLKRDKEKLEGIVAERTSELSEAYNEQQKISSELSETLDDLKRTQNDLVRMERTATAGKLTQGLIDRILNPINYINNFSKLTSGLAKDLHEDIEDEKENMSEDNYEDCEDILDMMSQNLQKIEEHGVNTTRTLRAMEAMLNNHIGALSRQDIASLCRQAVEVTSEHFKEDIKRCGITMRADIPDSPAMVNMDAESMNKVLLSLLTNSVYAVVKKYTMGAYSNPEVYARVTVDGDKTIITIHDNGIGIEDTIKDKVFDPFFTTKPTGEAAGVGLYLVRELVNDHNGTITLNSEKGEFCEFTITMHN